MILLLSCRMNEWKWETIKNNWLSECGIPYVIVVGNPNLEKRKYKYYSKTKILEVSCDDDYDDLTLKVTYAIQGMYELFDISYILKIDDDILLNCETLHRYLEAFKKNNMQYCGIVVDAQNGYMSDWAIDKYKKPENKCASFVPSVKYCGGPMYYLGIDAIRILYKNMSLNYHKFEDICVGITLNKSNIFPSYVKLYTENKSDMENLEAIAWHDNTKIDPQNNVNYEK